jgi:hypothetical protein
VAEAKTTTRRASLEPTTEEIRGELIRIRGTKEGLGAEAVIDHGIRLQLLRAVDDHIAKHDMRPGQRPDATVDVVRCAVNYLVKEPWKRFLHFTLLHPDGNKVEVRKELARIDASMQSTTDRDNIDAKSYRDLARALVNAPGSPCSADAQLKLAAKEAVIARAVLDMVDLLSDMGHDVTAERRRAAATKLAQQMPRGGRLLLGSPDPARRAQQLVFTAATFHSGAIRSQAGYLAVESVLQAVTAAAAAGAELEIAEEQVEFEVTDRFGNPIEVQRTPAEPDLRMTNTLIFIADALTYEERHGWPSLKEDRWADLFQPR